MRCGLNESFVLLGCNFIAAILAIFEGVDSNLV
jgi:hypothetical protein